MIYQIRQEQPPEEKAAAAGDGNLKTPMRLRDFLVGVATIYDLPDRLGQRIPVPHPLKKRERPPIPAWRPASPPNPSWRRFNPTPRQATSLSPKRVLPVALQPVPRRGGPWPPRGEPAVLA